MKKKLTVLAVAGALAAPLAAQAEAEIFGNVHVSISQFDNGVFNGAGNDELTMASHTSDVGVKGKMDLNYGLTGIYKVDFQFNADERVSGGSITDRDQWVGVSSKDFGTVRLGTISNNYKSSGSTIDPLYRTIFEGRGDLGAQSGLHGGAGPLGGRSTNTIRYDSPRMAGAKVVANYALAEGAGNVLGVGVHYKQGPIMAHFDYLNSDELSAGAMKFGGGYKAGPIQVGAQYELIDEELNKGGDTLFLNATYTVGMTKLALTYGMADETTSGSEDDHTGFALVADHMLSKKTDVYVGFASTDGGTAYADDSGFALGVRHKF